MTVEFQRRDEGSGTPRSIMPPYVLLRDFLDHEAVAGLLDYALAREPGRGEAVGVRSEIRVSVSTRDLGPFRPMLRSKVLGLVPDLVGELQTTPVKSPRLELELVAHNEGAFYKRHIDTQTAGARDQILRAERRLLFPRRTQGLFRRRASALRDRRRERVFRRHRAGAQFAARVPVVGPARSHAHKPAGTAKKPAPHTRNEMLLARAG